MADPSERERRSLRPPEEGWTLGAGGIPRPVWGALALVLLGLAILLLFLDYHGYGTMMAILAAAALVNVR